MLKNSFRSLFAALQLAALLIAFLLPNFVRAETKNSRQTVFSNTQPISINTSSGLTAPTTATLYPSTIEVAGMSGTITRVAVTLRGVTHARQNDMDFLLVSPTGAKYVFLSDANQSSFNAVEDRVYTFSDDAPNVLFNTTASGPYKPINGDGFTNDVFRAPAPAAPYNFPAAATFASVFNGANPNGTWSLYVSDDNLVHAGSVNEGWGLTITTNGAPVTFSNSNYIGLNDITTAAAPYGSPINVTGLSGVISSISLTLNGLSHSRPADMDVLLVSPNGKGVIVMSDVGNNAVNNVTLTFDESAPGNLPAVITSGTYRTTDAPEEFTDTYQPPAPLRPYFSVNGLNDLKGTSPLGEWRLYVVDDAQDAQGTIAGGWSLDITTEPAPPPVSVSCAAPTFATSNFPTGANPTNVAVADFNNDNKPDLAVTNQVSNDVSILLGDGNGTFGSSFLFQVGASPYALVAGKFNADNNVDLAVANSGANTVSILLGNGNGTFAAPTTVLAGASPISIAAGDLNNNGTEDLVVANFGGFFSGSVTVLLGNGNGGFTPGSSLRTRTQPSFVTIANINGDANRDVIVANFGSNSVATFFGTGNGTFQLNQNISTIGVGPVAIELFDSTLDGIADLHVANYNGDSVTSCTGNANGSFTGCSTSLVGSNPISLTSADFTGSGARNLATALSGANQVKVLTNNVNVGQFPNAVKAADFNGDGRPDIVAVNSGSNDVSILINSCIAARGNLFDYNGDRRTDYTVFRPSNQNWFTLFQTPGNYTQKDFARPTDKLVPADYTGDRLADYGFYRPETGLWFIQNTSGITVYYLQFGLPNDVPTPGDFDGDGKADIAVFRPSNGTWYVRRSSDNALQAVQFGMNGDKPFAVDFDGDGKDDFGVFRPSTGLWAILKSSDSQFILTTFGAAGDKPVPADYDGDGKADIAVFRPAEGAWYILQSSNSAFRAVTWGNAADVPVTGDFDGDGKYDTAVFRPSDGVWYILKSSDSGGLFITWGSGTDTPIPSVYNR